MSVEGCALQMLRACNINPHQIILLLHPFGGRMPNNEAEFSQLCTALRRQGHIMEGVPGNFSTLLRGPMREARPGAYVTDQQGDAIVQSPGTQQQTYFGRNQSASDQGDWGSAPWEATAGTIPFTDWTGGGSHWAEPTGHLADTGEVYAADYEEESWASTTTDTSSDSGEEDLQAPDVSQLSEAEATEQIYLRYRRAKRTWRRFTGRPVRKFRRHIKRHAYFRKGKGRGRKGKGKGKGHSRPSTGGFMWTRDDTLAYLKGKGKADRMHTSGKGFGRRRNPKDKHGNVMKCRICNSEEHFAAKCPNKGSGKGAGPPSGFFQHAPSAPSGSGSHWAEPAAADSPWANSDLEMRWFVQPMQSADEDATTHLGAYMISQDQDGEDPWMGQHDPWAEARMNLRPVGQPRTPSPGFHPRARRLPPGAGLGLRQADDDELSSARSADQQPRRAPPPLPAFPKPPAEAYRPGPPWRPEEFNAAAVAALLREAQPPRACFTPQPVNDITYVGTMAPKAITGQRAVDLLRVASSQISTMPVRNTPKAIPTPHMLRHQLPLSSAASRSAVPTARVSIESLPVAASRDDQLAMIQQTIALVQTARDNARELRRQDQAAHGAAIPPMPTVAPPPLPPQSVPQQPPRAETPTVAEDAIFFEGADDQCSICQEEFAHQIGRAHV